MQGVHKSKNQTAMTCIIMSSNHDNLMKPQHTVQITDETILQYIDILQYLLQQYNTIQLKGNTNILHIAIYYDILQYSAILFCLHVVNAQLLHHKSDWTCRNLDYTLEFLRIYTVIQGVAIFFSLLPKAIFPYEMSLYQNLIKYCNMAIYRNTLKHNT